MSDHPHLGYGLGLRPTHYPYIFEHKPAIDWFEVISENFMDTQGKPLRNLARIKEHYPIVLHGVSLSIGTVDPLNSEYLHKLKALIDWMKPAWVSDHLCWTGVAHKNAHDLLPLPYTEETLSHVVTRIRQVQDFLERPLALENPSTYLEFNHSEMPEAEFIARMAEESGCNLLLDVNNVYVTCYNHRLDAKAYLDSLPLDRVIQVHLSGHSNNGTHIIDTHDNHVIDEVWNLYQYAVHKAGRIPNTMVEWDDKIPEFPVLEAELAKAKQAAIMAKDFIIPELARSEKAQQLNRRPALLDAQMQMQDAIMRGDSFDSDPAQWIRAKEQFAPQEQLNVYVNAYRSRLYNVVAEDYPVLKEYLGDQKFHDVLWAFVNTEQPTHFNIGRFALKLPAFIAGYFPNDDFAHELCQLETTLTQLVDVEETTPLTPDHIHAMTPEALMQAQLYPRKALSLQQFSYPVNEYYRQMKEEGGAAKPQRQPSYMAAFRHEDSIWRMDLEIGEYYLLTKIFDGEPIGEALEGIDESAADKLSQWFSRWMRNGILAAHDYSGHQSKGNHHEAA